MVNPDRIAHNFDIFNFEFSKEYIEAIKTLNRNGRCNEPDIVSDDKLGSADNPFRHADDPVLLQDDTLAAIGKKYAKTDWVDNAAAQSAFIYGNSRNVCPAIWGRVPPECDCDSVIQFAPSQNIPLG